MKTEFSALEIHYLLDELKSLDNSKIDKIYQPNKNEILLQMHKTGLGKRIIRITGKLMYLTSHKSESPQTPLGFVTYLRKKLGNAILKEINQISSERIVELVFQTKEAQLKLIIELFGSGNIILIDDSGKIMSPMTIQKFKDRDVMPGQKYSYPQKDYDLFGINEKEFSEMLKKTKEKSIVKILALDLGLGGKYSEEACLLAGIDKKADKLSDKEIKTLYSKIKDMIKSGIDPRIILNDGKIIDITPFELEIYKDHEQKKEKTFNSALDSVITEHVIVKNKQDQEKIFNKELVRIQKSIDIQTKNIEKQKKSAEEDQKKGELIYEKYTEIKAILDDLEKARKKLSWKEIKEKLKGHPVVKEIDEKEGKIVVEV